MQLKKLGALLLMLSLSAGPLFAWPAHTAPVTCTRSDDPRREAPQLPSCILVPSKPNTWVIPAHDPQHPETPGEDEPNGEQIMTLGFGAGSVIFNPNVSPFPPDEMVPVSIFFISGHPDDVGGVDVIELGESANEAIIIFKPEVDDLPFPALPIGREDPITGFVGELPDVTITQADGTVFKIRVASDGEAFFDPFGYGADTSDGIQLVKVPEPASIALLGIGLLGLCFANRKRWARLQG